MCGTASAKLQSSDIVNCVELAPNVKSYNAFLHNHSVLFFTMAHKMHCSCRLAAQKSTMRATTPANFILKLKFKVKHDVEAF